MGLLDGKVALVTGAAGGICRATALRFASEGADVAFTYKEPHDGVETLAAEIESLGRRVKAYMSDAGSFDGAHAVVDDVISSFGRIDIMVCNAGVTRDGMMMRMTENQWDMVMENNLKSAFNYIHACTPAMVRQRSGSIICLTSLSGLSGNAGQANYAASKAGLTGLVKSVAKELGPRGVRANCIAPGFIETDMTAGVPKEIREEWIRDISLRRCGTPEDVAGVALFLASDLAGYVTGQVVNCCGGMKR